MIGVSAQFVALTLPHGSAVLLYLLIGATIVLGWFRHLSVYEVVAPPSDQARDGGYLNRILQSTTSIVFKFSTSFRSTYFYFIFFHFRLSSFPCGHFSDHVLRKRTGPLRPTTLWRTCCLGGELRFGTCVML